MHCCRHPAGAWAPAAKNICRRLTSRIERARFVAAGHRNRGPALSDFELNVEALAKKVAVELGSSAN